MTTLRRWIVILCRLVLARLDPPPALDDVTARATALIAEQEAIPDRSGEAKRHQVYARLLKTFRACPSGDSGW